MTILKTEQQVGLLELVKSQEWDQVIQRCKIARKKEFLIQDKASFLQTPLHLALRFKASIHVIREFTKHNDFSKAMEMRDNYCGYLPLHSAIRYKATSSVLFLLISKLNHSNSSFLLEQPDRNGMIPLHIACTFGSSLETIQVLVRANPLSTRINTTKGKSILFLASECSKITPEVLSFILKSINISNERGHDEYRGYTPLHMACMYTHDRSVDVVSLLVQYDPSACFQKTPSSEQTPLGLYFDMGSNSKEVIRLLLGPMMDGDGDDIGVVHRTLRFPQDVPQLLEFVLQAFPADVEKL